MKTTKLAPYSVSPALQRLFAYSALAAFVLPVGYEVYMAAVQYSTNPNLSAYYWVTIYMLVAPILFFKIAYLLSDKKKSKQARIFISVFLAASGMFALTAINTFVNQLMISLTIVFNDAFWGWLIFEVVTTLTVVALYGLLLLALKRKSGF